MIVEYAALTDAGQSRSVNEDSVLALELGGGEAYIFAVADGVGGLEEGATASRMVVDELARTFNLEPGSDDPTGLLVKAIQHAHQTIAADAQKDGGRKSASTIVALAVWTGGFAIAHAGDSRAYRLRGQTLQQLTVDHSLVAEQVRAGIISETEAATHARRNVITRSVGSGSTIDVDTTGPMPLEKGDTFILSSDGLHGVLDTGDIVDVVSADYSAEETCRRLVELANAKGGPDNISVVLVRVEES